MAEESDDYEEVLVYAEFSGLVETGESFWSNAPNHVGLLGLDTDEPLLQIGEVTFRGSFEDSVGSLMFFDGQSQDSSSALGRRYEPLWHRLSRWYEPLWHRLSRWYEPLWHRLSRWYEPL
eukprot:scpid107400/ scgid1741/ 